jgi:MOSC domain-containing protein YiiM
MTHVDTGRSATAGEFVTTGTLERIWRKRAHRGPMDPVDEALLVEGQGLEGSVGRSRRRQVTILAREDWDRCLHDLGGDADYGRRRANLLVSGLALSQTRGRVLRIGGARVRIGGELTPCERMDEVLPGLQAALRPNWGGGVFAQVITTGIVRVGDAVAWEDATTD